MGKYDLLFDVDKKLLSAGSFLLSVKRAPLLVKDASVLKKNRDISRYKNSDTCYVIGLGPSLKNVDLKKIKGDTLVTNRFVRFEGAQDITPTFYCLPDNAFYQGEHSSVLSEATLAFPNTVFLLNGKYRLNAERLISRDTTAFYTYAWKGFFNPNREIKLDKNLPIMGNVACYAIMIALGLGYKHIILLGCDFNSFANRKPVHCYIDAKDQKEFSMSFELFCYSFVADTHRLLNEYAKKHDCEIINATDGSLIDAYTYSEEEIQKYLKH